MSIKKFKSDISIEQGIALPNKTSQRALVIDASGNLVESNVTTTELDRLSGIASDLLETSDKGVANGVASLDANGKIPSSQVPAIAVTEVFTVADITARDALTIGSGDGEIQEGDVVRVLDASADANISSGLASYIYDGSAYRLLNADDKVLSVNGNTGVVVLIAADINFTQNNTGHWTVADGSSIKATLDEVGSRLNTLETAPSTDELVKVSANDTTGGYLEAKIVASNGVNATNALEASTLNDGADEDLQIQFDESKVDHDALSNFVANEHIDHSSVQIATAADSGLSGGGDLTTTRNLSLDITNTTALSADADATDEVIIYDTSAGALRKVTVSELVGNNGGNVSAGDILETSFSAADNQTVAADVTGLSFSTGTVRSFKAQVSIVRGATYEVYELLGVQKGASFDMSQEAVGDDTGFTFSITAAGQVQYTSTSTGSGATIKFRADTTSV